MDYQIFFVIVALLALVLSLMLLLAPKSLIKASEILNKDIDTTPVFTGHKKFFGALTTIFGFIMLYLRLSS